MAMDKVTMRVLTKLFEKGYDTEKKIMNISLEDMKTIECYSAPEVATIISLKEAVKANKVISYLSGHTEKDE